MNELWKCFGAHYEESSGVYKCTFRVFAPGADSVSLVSDVTGWDSGQAMTGSDGVWETVVESDRPFEGIYYKYAVTYGGSTVFKSDPFAFYSETMGKTASVVTGGFPAIDDSAWMKKRQAVVCPKTRGFKPKISHFYSAPLNIYQFHPGTWKNNDIRLHPEYPYHLNWRALGEKARAHVKNENFTHVELMALPEYQYETTDGVCAAGFFAPSARFGSCGDFASFVEGMHSDGIGVFADIPLYFASGDESGLGNFCGGIYGVKNAFESGCTLFDLANEYVRGYLISCVKFWLDVYHIDGIVLRGAGEQLSVKEDGCRGDELIDQASADFMRELNESVKTEFPDAVIIADSSPVPLTTVPVEAGGLGFSFVFDNDRMNELYSYAMTDSVARKFVHSKLTDPMMHAFSENYILPLDFKGLCGGNKTLIDKCFGDYDDKFGCMRTLLLYLITMPGKKLMFMGTEFAQFREWDPEHELEWFMTDYPRHIEMQRYVAAAGAFYKEHRELWDIDDTWDGFEWIDPDSSDLNILSFSRKDKRGHELAVVLNFSPVVRENVKVPVSKMGRYDEIFTTDRFEFGGRNIMNNDGVRTRFEESGEGRRCYIEVTVPAPGGIILMKQNND